MVLKNEPTCFESKSYDIAHDTYYICHYLVDFFFTVVAAVVVVVNLLTYIYFSSSVKM